jgi:hypothetical protein
MSVSAFASSIMTCVCAENSYPAMILVCPAKLLRLTKGNLTESQRERGFSKSPHALFLSRNAALKKKPDPCGPGCIVLPARSRQSPSRGEQLTAHDHRLGGTATGCRQPHDYGLLRASEQRRCRYVSHATPARRYHASTTRMIFRNSIAALSQPGSRGRPECAQRI